MSKTEVDPVVWVLAETLSRRETTTHGYLWFTDPKNSAWTPLYAHPPAPERDSLRELCAAAYQVVGAAGGPVEMLDNLAAAAAGKPLPHEVGAELPWAANARVQPLP